MFPFLLAVLLLAMYNYGGVQRHVWLALLGLWIAASAVFLIVRTARGKPLPGLFTASLVGCALLGVFYAPKAAVGLFCLPWAFLATQRSADGGHRFLHWLFFIGMAQAALGIVQYFISPGWIFGYINPSAGVSGTLINRNHFAGMLEMLIPVAIGFAFLYARKSDRSRSYLYLFCGSLMGISVVFSLSRTGIFTLFLTALIVALLVWWDEGSRGTGVAIALGFLVLVSAGAIWIGIDAVAQRWGLLLQAEEPVQNSRVTIYRDTIRMIYDNPMGVGPGRYVDRFRRYQSAHAEVLFDHTHNDYLEIVAEWGLVIGGVFWASMFFIVWRTVRSFVASHSLDQKAVLLACTGALSAICLHSLTDFNLQIPSNAMLFFTFAGVALAVAQTSRGSDTDAPRLRLVRT